MEHEKLLQIALHRTEAWEAHHEGRVIAMQASVVLLQKYCDRVQSQLESQEKKKKRGQGKGNKRLHGDGWPWLPTGDEFFNQVVHAEETHEKEAAEKEACKGKQDEHAKAVTEWKTWEEAWKARNEAKWEAWKQAAIAWETQWDLAKAQGKKWTGGKKPTLGGVEKAELKPKALPIANEDSLSQWEDEEEDDDE